MSTRSTRAELAELRKLLSFLGPDCETCRNWHGAVIAACDLDGTVLERSEEPTCPDCGREITHRVTYELIGVRLEDLR